MYKIFCAFGEDCWRQRTASGEFDDFKEACKEADHVCATDNYLRVDYTVANSRDGDELYRAKYIPNE